MQSEGESAQVRPLVVHQDVKKGPRRPRRKIVNSDSSSTERQLYLPELNEYKKLDLIMEKKRVASGCWSLEENRAYLAFLARHRRDFESQQSRRRCQVFNKLSKVLHKRTPDQCRSHHQKLQNRFQNDIDRIISFVRSKITRKENALETEGMKLEKATKPTNTNEISQVSEEEEGIVIDFQQLAIW